MSVDLTPYGPVTRALLGVRDSLLRRCTWCGAWTYGPSPCTTCHTTYSPATIDLEDAA